jgi:hypothetical protein
MDGQPLVLPQQWLRETGVAPDAIFASPAVDGLAGLYRKAAEAVTTLLDDGTRGLRRIASPALRREMCRLAAHTRRRARRLARLGPRTEHGPLSWWDRACVRWEGYRLWRRSM